MNFNKTEHVMQSRSFEQRASLHNAHKAMHAMHEKRPHFSAKKKWVLTVKG